MDERILGKIKKCLALSNSSEPNEAAAALRQAQKMMALHNVTQVNLKLFDLDDLELKSKASVSRIKDWELALINLIAKSFGCQLYWSKSFSHADDVFGSYRLVGLKSQVQIAHYTASVMQRKIITARIQFVRELPSHYSRARKIAEANGFCFGWVEAVSKTVAEFALNEEMKNLIKQKIRESTNGKLATVKRSDLGRDGLERGYKAGLGESIHRPMGEATHLKLGDSL